MRVENRSLKSFVKGRSSSVMRNILDDVWCMRPWFRSFVVMDADFEGTTPGIALLLCASTNAEDSGGEDGTRDILGRDGGTEVV